MPCPVCGWRDADHCHAVLHLQAEIERLKTKYERGGPRRKVGDAMRPIPTPPTLEMIALRLAALEELVRNDIVHRLDRIEGGISLLRWAIPVAVAIAAIILSRTV